MMAVILFLSLLIGANSAIARDLEDVLGFAPKSAIRQELLEITANLEGVNISQYRGGVDSLVRNTVSILDGHGNHGSGVLLSKKAAKEILGRHYASLEHLEFIVTAFHVIASGEKTVVLFSPKNSSNIEDAPSAVVDVLATLPDKDLALLVAEWTPDYVGGVSVDTRLGETKVGDDVQTIGHPEQEWWTYSRGYISQIRDGYNWSYSPKAKHSARVIQTQTPISAGNSGGPLFSESGELIGINCFQNELGQNLNFAVAASELSAFEDAVNVSVSRIDARLKLENNALTAVRSNFLQVEQWNDEGVLHTLYEDRNVPMRRVVALAPPNGNPYFVLSARIDQKDHYLVFDIDHENSGAIFRVTVFDDQYHEHAKGWDFNGDFEMDYLP